jgi:hypothetical protein
MKLKFLTAIVLLAAFNSLSSQTYAPLHINNTRVVVSNNGSLFWDGENGQFLAPFTPGEPATSTLRTVGLWVAGYGESGNLKGAAQLYNEDGRSDFQPGPISELTGEPIDRLTSIYRVTGDEIAAHLADFEDNSIIDNPIPNVFGWPANGNIHFSEFNGGAEFPEYNTQGLAGFYDRDADTSYDPEEGDFPYFHVYDCEVPMWDIPDEMLYFVFNDKKQHTESGMAPMDIEFQCTVLAFNCKEGPLGNSVIVYYKIINRGTENLEQAYFGNFVDFEIGNGNDDFFGSDSERSMVFAYNGDNEDEGGYGSNPPTMSVDQMQGLWDPNFERTKLRHVMPVPDPAPNTPIEYYNLLRGLNVDGSTAPNNGVFYDGNPNDPNEWSELSEGNTPGHRKVLASFGPFLIPPGARNEIILSYSFYQGPNGNVQQNLEGMYQQADALQSFFDNCFDGGGQCTQAVSATTERNVVPLSVFPNPTAGTLTVTTPSGQINRLEIRSLDGRSLQKVAVTPFADQTTLQLDGLPNGFYLLNAYKEGQRVATKKVVVIK